MGLSDEEAKVLRRLMKKKDEPDAPAASRALNISLDLGDEKQVKRAQSLGLLGAFSNDDGDDDDDDAGDDDDDTDAEDIPKRRGYFPEGKKK